ncbi:MAG: response regulator [Actinobacteria bacterium]|nr:response regulator [Actinomycetota bacterium]
MALVVAAVAGLALVGIGMGVTAIPGVSQQARMALMTAVTFVVLAVGCGCASPDSASLRRFFSAGSGGLTVRRLLPVALVLPVVLGSLRLFGEQAGLFGAEVGTWLLIVAVIICIGGLVWQLSGSIERGDRELRQAEHDLRRAVAEAERASDAKSQFLSGVSHELRTPLNAILGFGQLLELDDLDTEQHESAQHIVEAGRHLLGLVNEVLDIARIESGKLTVSVEPVALGPVLEEVTALIGPLGRERGITVEVDPGAGGPRWLLVDRQRLQQIFINLVSNAIKYNHDGGWVRVYCEPRAGERLAIVVADGGPGIAVSNQERMFEPFERIGDHGAEGTGLGLALARHLAELMGGSLAVDSQPGAGARFILTLPLSVRQPADLCPASRVAVAIGPEPDGLSGDVLYVEDNPANIALVESICARAPGLRLRTAATGQGGLDAARRQPPDLILLDLHLPDLGGGEVLGRLRSRPTTAHTPVLILTADATSGQRAKLLAAGADGYLTKPLDMRELHAEISRLLPAGRPGFGSGLGSPGLAASGTTAVIPA